MNLHDLLGQLSRTHQMMVHLLESVPEPDCYRSFVAGVPPLAWLLGRGVYAETYWVREVVEGDDDLTARVRRLFAAGVPPDDPALATQLPPRDHLLNWAMEAQDENLMRLANPERLPDHPLRADGRLLPWILREQAQLYESMLVQLTARRAQEETSYRAAAPLQATGPSVDHADVHRGHYRVGARNDAAAFDNELPTQAVELDAFRIDRRPVTNGAWLGFIEAGGYREAGYWSEAGRAWLKTSPPHPYYWRQDETGAWYGVGLNGPFDLVADEPVSGVSRFEAEAFAAWAAEQGDALAGAVLQHEYQWEVAVRSRAVSEFGRVWEWCGNPFHPYSGYAAPDYAEAATTDFEAGHFTLRGGSLHTQPVLRRLSYRHHAVPGQRALFSGVRLVFPASDMPWH